MLAEKLSGAVGNAANPTYIEDVFSTYLYTGNGASQAINNGIALGDGPANGTVLHLTGDSLSDSAPVPNTLTVNGNTAVSTSVFKYGTGSIYFDGTGDWITVADSSSFNMWNSDFTIEGWFYPTGNVTAGKGLFGKRASNSVVGGILFYFSSTGLTPRLLADIGGSWGVDITASSGFTANQWNHFAVVRNGSTWTIYINGTSVGSVTNSGTVRESTAAFSIMAESAAASEGTTAGYIDDFRVTKGTARYTSNFTAPTAALPLDTLTTGKGGMVWTKSRSNAISNIVVDSVRGGTNALITNSTAANSADTGYHISSFNSNGYSLQGAGSGDNYSGYTYASWTFRKQPKFFDVVTYTGNGTTQNIAHSLGGTVGCVIVKDTGAAGPWHTWHRGLTSGNRIVLNTTAAQTSSAIANVFGNNTSYVAPTSTQFTVGDEGAVNANGGTYVAYIFAHDAGGFGLTGTDNVISCGSYTGNGTLTGVDVSTGFETQFVLVKKTNSTSAWAMFDIMRGASLPSDNIGLASELDANTSTAEATNNYGATPRATGFNVSGNGSLNTSGSTYIYIAIRRGPMKVPTDGTTVFAPAYASSSGTYTATAGFPVDMFIYGNKSSTGSKSYPCDRLRGQKYLNTNSTAAEASDTVMFDRMTSVYISSASGNYSGYINWLFRRAPSFFDEVCYTGTGAIQNISHNLGVTPTLILTKTRTGVYDWLCYSETTGTSNTLFLNLTDASTAYTSISAVSSTTFTVPVGLTNTSGDKYVAYLFATCAGVSKVGSYTGTGTTKQVDCGFAAGARFVLIKRTDSTGDWYVWDTARGIVSGNDPYLLLNSTAAETTTTDYIDTYSAGFELSSTAPAAINASGGTYIFLAIA